MTKNEWKKEKACRQRALEAFEAKHPDLEAARELVEEHERLRKLASADAPEKYVRCSGHSEDGSRIPCNEIVLEGEENLPKRWAIQPCRCGENDTETVYCPRHAHQVSMSEVCVYCCE